MQYDREKHTATAIDLVDGADQALQIRVTVTRTWAFDDLFVELDDHPKADARLKLVRDPGFGWNGFEIRAGAFYSVNYQLTDDGGRYLKEERVSREHVEQKIRDAVDDDMLGDGKGDFRTGMLPP
jgi:hypothetical protein